MNREIKFRNTEFVDILNYEGFYQANSNGEVRSLDRYVNHHWGGKCLKKGKVLKPSLSRKGYLMVSLTINGKGFRKSLHRIIAETFIPNPENKPQVNHKDGDKLNNSVENLEWVDGYENIRHAFKTGLNKGSMMGRKGEKHPRTILTDKDVENIKKLIAKGTKVKHIAEAYNVNSSTVTRSLHR